MSTIAVCDVDGTIIPGAELDELYELGFDDPEYGDPAEWPAWTDNWTFEEGPAIPADAVVFPPESVGFPGEEVPLDAHGDEFEPSADDLADYAEWSAEIDRLWWHERIESGITDQDIAAAGLAVG